MGGTRAVDGPARYADKGRGGTLAEHELVVSETVLAEFERVLGQKLRLPLPQVKTLSSFLRRQADIVDPVAPRSAEGGWKIFLQFSQTDQSGGSRV